MILHSLEGKLEDRAKCFSGLARLNPENSTRVDIQFHQTQHQQSS